MSWELRWQSNALRDLSRLDAQTQRRIAAAVEHYVATAQGDVLRLRDVHPPEWRLRVGKWRIRFRKDDGARVVHVLRVLPRDKAY